jgi:hypothetical protein
MLRTVMQFKKIIVASSEHGCSRGIVFLEQHLA